jgi:hypothetical protein
LGSWLGQFSASADASWVALRWDDGRLEAAAVLAGLLPGELWPLWPAALAGTLWSSAATTAPRVLIWPACVLSVVVVAGLYMCFALLGGW